MDDDDWGDDYGMNEIKPSSLLDEIAELGIDED